MARALWSGAITFGLVNIPVKMFRATAAASAKSVGFHQIHKSCGTRLQQKRWCPKDDVEVPWKDVAKGYEVSKGRYVLLTEADLDKLLPEDDYAAVAIDNFVELAAIDPIFFDRAYYLAPDGSPKAYVLLQHALESSGKVAIAHVTLRTRAHLAVVRAVEGRLVLSTMFFHDEVVDPAEVPGMPEGKAAQVDKKQTEAALQLIDSMTVPWDPSRYEDEYTAKVSDVIESKVNEGEVTESLVPAEPSGGKVVNLLEALKQSIAARQQTGTAPAAELKPVAPTRKRHRAPTQARKRPARKKTG